MKRLNKSTVFELMECFFEFFLIIGESKLLLICDIKESFSCFQCSKSFVLSTIFPLGLLRGGFDDVRVWQDESVLVGPSIFDVLKLQEADIIFAFSLILLPLFFGIIFAFRSPLT